MAEIETINGNPIVAEVASESLTPVVDAWMAAHPEATTTVQDGAVSTAKLADGAVTDAKLVQTGGMLSKVRAHASIEQLDMLDGVEFRRATIDTVGGAERESTTRLVCGFFPLDGVASFTIWTDDGYRHVVDWYDQNQTITRYQDYSTRWRTESHTYYAHEFGGAAYVKFLLSKLDDSAILLDEAVHLHATYSDELVSFSNLAKMGIDLDLGNLDWELGTIIATTGENASSTTRIRSEPVYMGAGSIVMPDQRDGVKTALMLHYFDHITGEHLGASGSTFSYHNMTVPYDCDVKILIGKSDAGTFDVSEIDEYVGRVEAFVVAPAIKDETIRLSQGVLFTTSAYYFEPVGSNGGMWLFLGDCWVRGSAYSTMNWSNILPESHAASPSGHPDCLLIPHNKSLVFDIESNSYSIVDNGKWLAYRQIPIFCVGTLGSSESVIAGLGVNIYSRWLSEQSGKFSTTTKALAYAGVINASGETEQFIYFSDPHLMGSSNSVDYVTSLDAALDIVKAYAESTPASFVMCGGDWLNSGDNPTYAKWKLGMAYGRCSKLGTYRGVVGNHDTNYQGVDAGGNANSGTLSNNEIAAAMFAGEHANYYSFDGNHTRFYVFDSGTDWDNTMTAYRWQQIAWFANALQSDDKPNSAISIHIWYTNYQDQTDNTVSTFAANITSIIAAYNGRTAVTLNGSTYNFASCTGHIGFIVCGHTHFDKSGTAAGIPVMNTLNLMNGGTPSFDLVYVDYGSGVIKTVRVGTGSDRTFNL